MQDSGCSDHALQELYTTWRTAESKAHRIFEEINDNESDPRYIEAEKESNIALHEFLRKPTSSLQGVLLKLRIACHFEDYMADALDPTCTLIGPRAIVAAMHDLENVIIKSS
jgi:hypothetical protein